MIKRNLLVLFALLFSVVIGGFAANTLDCQFKVGSCDTAQGEIALFYAHKDYVDTSGKVLSSNTRGTGDSNYNKPLCCKSAFGHLSSYIESTSNACTGEDVMYFTNSSNARVAFEEYKSSTVFNFNKSFYSKMLCVNIPSGFGSFNIIASDTDYSIAGYTCMYKTNSLENGMVSACDATFNAGNSYKYTVWGRLWEKTDSLNCNNDCTSKIDGRVYYQCSSKLENCKDVPILCDGSLLNSWVIFNSTHEVQCSFPWNVYREKVLTGDLVDISSKEDKCDNLISTKYTVMLSNEMVTMDVYVCDNK